MGASVVVVVVSARVVMAGEVAVAVVVLYVVNEVLIQVVVADVFAVESTSLVAGFVMVILEPADDDEPTGAVVGQG
eukprot:CAMPEP_0181094152 /NCGR_PEP_ID=MMETSP1071-20121207/9837_1 /TAXON_ID=35127 /ORGANISM="Thalassiosira sp., Strain NH16" /LENGTH=75 /DNA_ID=CAMNT_0023176455 /DNA_START=329 /DNA_END=556 /DNA_ORIENTATION=+